MVARRPIPSPTPHCIEALKAKADKSIGLCWRWLGAYSGDRGVIRLNGFSYRVQRVAYAWLVGPLNPENDVRARCGVIGCISPKHLEAVSRQESGSRAYWLGMRGRDALVRRCKAESELRLAALQEQQSPRDW